MAAATKAPVTAATAFRRWLAFTAEPARTAPAGSG